MIYSCRYPGKLINLRGYSENVFEEYKEKPKYAHLAKKASITLLDCILFNIKWIIESPKETLESILETVQFLSTIPNLTKEAYDAISLEKKISEKTFKEVAFIFCNPIGYVSLNANNMKLQLEGVPEAIYGEFFKEASKKCFEEVINCNLEAIERLIKERDESKKLKSTKVRFAENIEEVPDITEIKKEADEKKPPSGFIKKEALLQEAVAAPSSCLFSTKGADNTDPEYNKNNKESKKRERSAEEETGAPKKNHLKRARALATASRVVIVK